MSKIKEFEELPSMDEYLNKKWDKKTMILEDVIQMIKKDAWNAAIMRASDDCIFYCDKQLVLTQLIDD